MYEADDRLVGDLVWEIFEPPGPAPGPARRRIGRRAVVAGMVGLGWWLVPPIVVLATSLAMARREFRAGGRIARMHPGEAGARICVRFKYAWGAWKIGWTAFGWALLGGFAFGTTFRPHPSAWTIATGALLAAAGLTASAILTAWAVGTAYWTGTRVRLAEGDLDRAWNLMLGMMLVGLADGVILPICVWIDARYPGVRTERLEPGPGIAILSFAGIFLIPGGLLWARELIALRIFEFGPEARKPGAKASAPIAHPGENRTSPASAELSTGPALERASDV